MVMRSRATDGRSASKCLRKHPKQPSRLPGRDRIRPRRSSVLLEGRKSANIYAGSGFIRGIPVKRLDPAHRIDQPREDAMRRGALAILVLLAQPAFAGEKDKLYSSTLDVRTVLSFKVADSAAQKMLPDGWQVESPNAGPSKGSNVSVVLVDQILAQDAEGKPVDAIRGAALVIPAKKQGMDKAVSMVVGGLFSPTSYAPGPYGNFIYAKADLDRKSHSDPAGTATVEESWSFVTDGGDSVQFQVQYTRGAAMRAKIESLVYSGTKPDFYRVYRVEQATDVVRSTVTGTDRAQKVSFKVSGRQLTPLFNGSEQLISITAIPWYTRQIFLPGS